MIFILPFDKFWKYAVFVLFIGFIMFVGSCTRHDTIKNTVIANAQRVQCPLTIHLDTENRVVKYTAGCDFGEVEGTLDTFEYFTKLPDSISCYKVKYTGDTFTDCSLQAEKN